MPGEFLSTLSLRRATAGRQLPATEPPNFYPRSPCGERRQAKQTYRAKISISIHALLAESDPRKSESLTTYLISIHALLAESDETTPYRVAETLISIHALLAESDTKILLACCAPPYNFYPRSPCGERRPVKVGAAHGPVFLSTLSLRRATYVPFTMPDLGKGFLSTLSLRRATIRAYQRYFPPEFLSTLSLRRATCGNAGIGTPISISIHALLAESDAQHASNILPDQHFYPRSPCGERQILDDTSGATYHFYPRSPCGERPSTTIITICTV